VTHITTKTLVIKICLLHKLSYFKILSKKKKTTLPPDIIEM